MAITQAMCTSFKKELLEAKHNFLASGGKIINPIPKLKILK